MVLNTSRIRYITVSVHPAQLHANRQVASIKRAQQAPLPQRRRQQAGDRKDGGKYAEQNFQIRICLIDHGNQVPVSTVHSSTYLSAQQLPVTVMPAQPLSSGAGSRSRRPRPTVHCSRREVSMSC